MNTNLVLWSALASIALGLFALGWMTHSMVRRRRHLVSPISVDGLADRADVNGSELVRLARDIRKVAANEQRGLHQGQMLRWAAVIEGVAVEHLECINAITLDSLAAVGDRTPVHLGDFGGRRRNPLMGPVSSLLIRGGKIHG